ncbi:MAG TPA: hypothetical protein VEW03_12760 [Longimicrobiaceae bacterium]|nr:hypothetical protein [Longimicrobiaceae bacterium]
MPETPGPDRLQKRKNLVLLLVLALLTVAVALYPTVCTYVEQPQAYYPSAATAPRDSGAALPALVPASATEVHERRDRGSGRTWVRFTYRPEDADRIAAGLRRLPLDEVRRLQVPGPSFTPWWTLSSRTLQASPGERLRVYEVAGGDAGWLALDPRSNLAFYWSR